MSNHIPVSKTKEMEIDSAIGLKAISIRLDIELIADFKAIAKEKNRNYQYLMREALKSHIKDLKAKSPLREQ